MTTTRRQWALVILGAWIAGSICMSRFWILHAAYTSLEMLKLVGAVLVAASLAKHRDARPAHTATNAA